MHAPRRPTIQQSFRDGDRARFVVTGDVDPKEWLTAYEGFVQSEPCGHVLWDLTGGSLNVLSSADVRDLARRVGAIRDRKHSDGRIALVCARDVDFGIARMFVVFAGCADPHGPMQVFRDSDAAWRWLSSPRDAAFAEEPELVEGWGFFSVALSPNGVRRSMGTDIRRNGCGSVDASGAAIACEGTRSASISLATASVSSVGSSSSNHCEVH